MGETEFFKQGDQERDLGLPITPMMDRTKDSLATGQGFFLGKLVLPILELYNHFMEKELADFFRSTLTDNKDKWAELVEEHGKKSAQDLIALDDGINQDEA